MGRHSGIHERGARGFEAMLREQLSAAFGGGGSVATASAPGRCTLVGEHVDYAGGLVLCAAIDLDVGVALRAAGEGADRVSAGVITMGRSLENAVEFPATEGVLERADPLRPRGGGYVFAAADALRARGLRIPALEAVTAASLPAGAGLASSAAVIAATQVALLRLHSRTLTVAELIDAAYAAEHDILGVPSGRLDEHAIVESPDGGAILLDCAADAAAEVPWRLADVALCVCDTGQRHSVAGAEYRRRREETEAALCAAGAANAQEIAFAVDGPLTAFDSLDPGSGDVATRRLRHVVTETRRARAAAGALRAGDAPLLGRLMSASHRSLRADQEVSTPLLNSVVAAAESVAGCYGARLVGAGFGGSVLALSTAAAATTCGDAMRHAGGEGASSWVVHASPGLAFTAGDVVTRG